MGRDARRNRRYRAEDAALARDLKDQAHQLLVSHGLTPGQVGDVDESAMVALIFEVSSAVKSELAKRVREGRTD
jgi:hypothetical protein